MRTRAGDTPGLDELYLTTMDAIESLTPGDAMFMVQGSVAAGIESPLGERTLNAFNLTTGAEGNKCCPCGMPSQLPVHMLACNLGYRFPH